MTQASNTQNASPIPVSVITGFLGSGKTTLLNELIKHPNMDKVAVLVNEFGEIGLDHLLVESISEDIVLLQSGCICCQLKDDLANTLFDLFNKRKNSQVDAFTRVLIETTGIADPIPVVQVLIADPLLSSLFRLDGVITLVDAIFGETQLTQHDESIKQVALADKLLLTKTDLIAPTTPEPLIQQLKQINPSAPLSIATKGDIHPEILFGKTGINDTEEQRQLNTLARLNKEQHSSHSASANHQHRTGITSASISLDEPIEWELFSEWLDSLIFSRAENILRIKGILNIKNKENPVVIQGVQHIFYPPSTLTQWPTPDHRSQLVFITYNLNPHIIERCLKAFLYPELTMPDIPSSGILSSDNKALHHE